MARNLNRKALQLEILRNKTVKNFIRDSVIKEVEIQKKLFLQEFESHPVTEEIEGGTGASNVSGTLGGYGNLYSFLGFSNATPTSPVKFLIKRIAVNKNPTIKNYGYQFKIIVPSKDEFASVTKLPWEGGRSWLFDIEKTISGLGAFLYGKFSASRSGGGIQSQYNYSGRIFKPTKYFTDIYNKFLFRIGAK
jgi:hypothetical protein